jgi:hypothetical protein
MAEFPPEEPMRAFERTMLAVACLAVLATPALSQKRSCRCEDLKSTNGGRYFTSKDECNAYHKRTYPNEECDRKVKKAITEAKSCDLKGAAPHLGEDDYCWKGRP